jgi:hypothetical protein
MFHGVRLSRRTVVVCASVDVPAARQVVWDFLHAAESAFELNEDVVEAATLAGPVGLGERQRFVRRHGDHTHEWVVEVVAYDEPSFVATEEIGSPFAFRCEMTVADCEGGTRVTHTHTKTLKREHLWRLRQAGMSRQAFVDDDHRALVRELDKVRLYFSGSAADQ